MSRVTDIASARPAAEASEAAARPLAPGAQGEAFWNWPNTITVFRIAVVPVMLFIPFAQGKLACQIFAWCFIVAAVSDIIDGWLARRGAQVTKIGKLLDPLADKLLVSTALIMLIAAGRFEWYGSWMVVVIIGRELAVTGLRGIASSHGHIVAASWEGKLKTLAQNIAIAALLFRHETLGLPAHEIGVGLLFIATVLTLGSGYLYFADYFGWPRPGRRALSQNAEKGEIE